MSERTNEKGQSFEERVAELTALMPMEIAVDITRIEFGLDPSDTIEIDDNAASDDTNGQRAARE